MLLMEIPEQKSLIRLHKEDPGQRLITKAPRQKRRRGRPRSNGIPKRPCRFELTPVGYLLCHRCETEWLMLTHAVEDGAKLCYRLILSISYSSDNPVFRTEEWRRALIDFRRYGLRTPNAVKEDLDREIRYLAEKLCGRLEI